MIFTTIQPYLPRDFHSIIGLLLISSTLSITGCSGDQSPPPPNTSTPGALKSNILPSPQQQEVSITRQALRL